ncbi:2'-5' RNA ligase family protein [Mesorhizobium sp. IMUNJ 23232]|uniref:2'-5' RNA ligase family protein n=1 Tax=Mesorhizobium sp. IMUNJ 23232 TaxID=3376064 RepID=UPI0037B6F3B0
MFGITIRTSSDAQLFWRLVKRASALERSPSMEALGYAPHITLARYSEGSDKLLLEAASRLRDQNGLLLTFDRISFFDIDPIVLWLSPLPDQRLFDLHGKLHEAIDPQLCDPHYRPLQWTPHLTLATTVDIAHRNQVLELTSQPFERITLRFDAVDCVSWPPVRILSTLQLA